CTGEPGTRRGAALRYAQFERHNSAARNSAEAPFRARFANFSLRRTKFEKRISMAQQPGPGQLGDWDLRDYFAQPSDSPNHCVEAVGRSIKGAIPFAAERHHFRF